MQKILENLLEAKKRIVAVDHLTYVTFPLIQDKKLLIKIILELKKAMVNCITAILQHECLFKRIKLSRDPQVNFQTFREKSYRRFGITSQEINLILELFEAVRKHDESSMEFLKNEKIVILSVDMDPKIISIEKTKEFLEVSKNILNKVNVCLLRKI